MNRITLTISLIAGVYLSASSQENPLTVFSNLVGSAWVSEGEQLGGHQGKTVKEFSWGLDGKIIKVKTFATDPETLEFGLRNEGVRFLNNESNQLEFYEFDKLGGVSKGIVKIQGENIYYEYQYGGLLLRDSWVFISKDEYLYRVCSLKDSECDQVYHKGVFNRKE
ncbi:hypothetical protein [Ekhidna sp.]